MRVIFPLFLKIFIYVLIGLSLGLVKRFNLKNAVQHFIDFLIYIIFPIFVFMAIWTNQILWSFASKIMLVSLSVLVGGSVGAWGLAKIKKRPFRDFCLPIIFANSAYLGIPTNTLIFGPSGTVYAVIYDLISTLAFFTWGIFFIAKTSPWRQIFKLPYLYAIILGFVFKYLNIEVKPVYVAIFDILKFIVTPLILMLVGYQLAQVIKQSPTNIFWGVFCRMGGGLTIAWLVTWLFSLTDIAKGVCMVSASMPSAVNSYIFAKKYEANPDFAARMVLVSTVISLILIPVLALFVTK